METDPAGLFGEPKNYGLLWTIPADAWDVGIQDDLVDLHMRGTGRRIDNGIGDIGAGQRNDTSVYRFCPFVVSAKSNLTELCLDESGRDLGHADRCIDEIHAKAVGQGVNGMLCRAVNIPPRVDLMTRNRTDVDRMTCPLRTIPGTTALVMWRSPLMLVSIISSKSSGDPSWSLSKPLPSPALLTRMSISLQVSGRFSISLQTGSAILHIERNREHIGSMLPTDPVSYAIDPVGSSRRKDHTSPV
ncbi:MAG: hypothetical protein MZV49_12960 [Rhodopseudomonas palustris]|nr:hypothetical protein [Rhodopseudomonas palustris]